MGKVDLGRVVEVPVGGGEDDEESGKRAGCGGSRRDGLPWRREQSPGERENGVSSELYRRGRRKRLRDAHMNDRLGAEKIAEN